MSIKHSTWQIIKYKRGNVHFGILCYCNKVWVKMKFFSMGKSTELPEVEFRQQSMHLSNHFSTNANVKNIWCITSTSSYTFKVHELSLPVPCYYFNYSNEKWVPEHAGVQENWIPDELARDGSALMFVGPEPALEVSRQDTRRRIRRLVNQRWVWSCDTPQKGLRTNFRTLSECQWWVSVL